MTVGVAAICEQGSGQPGVIVGADRLVTTQQLSAIEHESPSTKIKQIGAAVPSVRAVSVFAGDVSWAETLHEMIEETSQLMFEQEDVHVDMPFLAHVAGSEYRNFTRDRIENNLLSHFGIRLEELQHQHRFKDSFIDDVKTEIDNAREQINQGLRVLIGGVDTNGPSIYEVRGGDQLGHNDMGYSAIGSGEQPAASEFLESEYSSTCTFDEGLATVTAATLRARQARGVGGQIDLYSIGPNHIERADEDTISALKERYERISTNQERLKEEIRSRDTVEWSAES